jgi:hypothetical protein
MWGFFPKSTSSYKFHLQIDKSSKMTKKTRFLKVHIKWQLYKKNNKKKTCALKKCVFGSGSHNTYRHMNVQWALGPKYVVL